jgi:hypothetical protein
MMTRLSDRQARLLQNFQRGIYEETPLARVEPGWVSLGGRSYRTGEALARRGLLEQKPGSGGLFRLTGAGCQFNPASLPRARASHAAQVPPMVADYFGAGSPHPIIVQVFRPGDGVNAGWRTTGYRKRVSAACLRKFRRDDGVTHVLLDGGGRRADFSIDEILRAQVPS